MSAIFSRSLRQFSWSTIVLLTLGFWLSASLVLDSLVIPGLFFSGMMLQDGFASASYFIFGIFNHIELLAAGVVLTGYLIFARNHSLNPNQESWAIILSSLLFGIALIYTYFFTPEMSSLGLQLNLFEPSTTMPKAMISLHEGYWFLEILKFLSGTILLSWCYRNYCRLD